MNAEKYTKKTIETINTAQAMAQENGNQYLTSEHLLYALVDQDGGLIGSLLGKMGVDCDALLAELDTEIRKLPRISGGSGEVYASPELNKITALRREGRGEDGRRVRLRRAPDAGRVQRGQRRRAGAYSPTTA